MFINSLRFWLTASVVLVLEAENTIFNLMEKRQPFHKTFEKGQKMSPLSCIIRTKGIQWYNRKENAKMLYLLIIQLTYEETSVSRTNHSLRPGETTVLKTAEPGLRAGKSRV